MDMMKIGSFLAQLRKEKGLTQEQLGEMLGVTNKTVSRWETGNYMPPVEMLQQLSTYYGLTINEILSGQRLSEGEYREHAEENMKSVLAESAFSLQDKIEFYKRKWRKDHFWTGLLLRIAICCWLLLGIFTKNAVLCVGYLVGNILFYLWERNEMMKYVEDRAFDGSGRH